MPWVRSRKTCSFHSTTGRGMSSDTTNHNINAIANASDGTWQPLPRAAAAVEERLSSEKRAGFGARDNPTAEWGYPTINAFSRAVGLRHLSAIHARLCSVYVMIGRCCPSWLNRWRTRRSASVQRLQRLRDGRANACVASSSPHCTFEGSTRNTYPTSERT